MQQIIHNIPLIAQEAESQYFTASLAMMLSWKSGEKQDMSFVSKKIQTKDQTHGLFNKELITDDIKAITKVEGMTSIDSLPIQTEDLSFLIFQSPLLAVFYSEENKKMVYAVVIAGIMGDGSLTDTFVHIQDPDRISKGKKYKIPLLNFYREFSRVVAANNNLAFTNINQFYCYYDSKAKMTTVSTHQSFSSKTQSSKQSFEWENNF
jgi:Papain-like cysteine protease AvrRpt2